MKKLIVIIMFYLFIVGCSSAETRFDMADQIVDEVVYQREIEAHGANDLIIGYTKDHLYIIHVSAAGNIWKIASIPKGELFKGDL